MFKACGFRRYFLHRVNPLVNANESAHLKKNNQEFWAKWNSRWVTRTYSFNKFLGNKIYWRNSDFLTPQRMSLSFQFMHTKFYCPHTNKILIVHSYDTCLRVNNFTFTNAERRTKILMNLARLVFLSCEKRHIGTDWYGQGLRIGYWLECKCLTAWL